MFSLFFTAKKFLLDLLFPIVCLGCGVAETYLCAACFAKIPLQESFVCPGWLTPSFENAVCAACRKKVKIDGLIAASFYDSALLRRLIFAYKYKFVKPLAVPLAQLILKAIAAHAYSLFHRGDLVLIATPLSKRRERWRGFNQAGEIARILANTLSLPLAGDVLLRTRDTLPQVETESRQERLDNLAGAFRVADPGIVKNKAILLVDDIATSLATFNECAKILKSSGAREVWGLAVAREYFKKVS